MPNRDASFGFRLTGHANSTTPRIRRFFVPATNTQSLFVGDPVVRTDTANSIGEPQVARATVNSAITGVINSVELWSAGKVAQVLNYLPANTAGYLQVVVDTGAEFEVQMDGTLTATMIGLNAAIIFTNAGSTITGQSGAELDTGTTTAPATTATLPFKIKGLEEVTDNEMGAFARVVVMMNATTEAPNTAGI